jgi:hypothetical protein
MHYPSTKLIISLITIEIIQMFTLSSVLYRVLANYKSITGQNTGFSGLSCQIHARTEKKTGDYNADPGIIITCLDQEI